MEAEEPGETKGPGEPGELGELEEPVEAEGPGESGEPDEPEEAGGTNQGEKLLYNFLLELFKLKKL